MAFFAYLTAIIFAGLLARFGIALLKADKVEAWANASRAGSVKDAVMGRVQIHNDWLPDARVQGGMVFNEKDNRIEICGRVSDESLDRTFR